jgi:hypothetical protein
VNVFRLPKKLTCQLLVTKLVATCQLLVNKLKSVPSELILITLIALLIRLLLVPYFSTIHDPYFWARGMIFFNNGYDPYTLHISVYPPFIYLFYSPLFRFVSWVGFYFQYFTFVPELGASIVTPGFLFIWKMPLLVFDFFTAFIIYALIKHRSGGGLAILAFTVWLLNPLNLSITYMHGAWDLVVGFLILLGIFTLYKKDYFVAGLCFGLGAIVKLAPVYLVLPFLLILVLQGTKNQPIFFLIKQNLMAILKFIAGLLLTFLLFIPLILSYIELSSFLPFNSTGDFIWNNLNQWFFASHPIGFQWINSHVGIIQKLPMLYLLVSAIVVVLFYKLNLLVNLTMRKFLSFGVFFGILSLMLYPSIIQSQYLLWYLPLFVCLVFMDRCFKWPFVLLSIAGVLYYFASQGPVTPFGPFAVYSGIFSIPQYLAGQNWFYNLPVFITGISFQKDLLFLSGLASFIALLISLYLCLKYFKVERKNA